MSPTSYEAEISSIRTLGGVGSILVLLVGIPFAGIALGIAGLALILTALKKLSNITKDESIFKNALIAFIISIVAIAVFSLVIISTFLAAFMGSSFGGPGTIKGITITPSPSIANPLSLLVSIIAALVIFWVLLIVSSYFLYKSYKSVALNTGAGLFSTLGLLYLIGALLTIILVGLLIILVAVIIQIIAFFTLPGTFKGAEAPGQGPPPQPPSHSTV